jgi:hypothetical protein
VCLETLLLKRDISVSERLARIQQLTSKQDPKKMAMIDIDKAKREGRAWSLSIQSLLLIASFEHLDLHPQ